jgi:uncharacterized protein YhfF
MKYTITVETKKEIEINYPLYFKIQKDQQTPTYYAAVSEEMAISIFSMRDVNVFSFASVILRHVECEGYVEISSAEFESALQQTFTNIKDQYSKQLGL